MSVRPQIALSRSFLDSLSALPKAVQKKAREFAFKFQENPKAPSINYESIADARDPKIRTVRIDLSYRAIVVHPPEGNVYLLVWVDHHDEAMAWARNKRFDVHATTGAIQVLDMEAVASATDNSLPNPDETVDTMFGRWADAELLRVGLPEVLLPAIRAVRRDTELDALKTFLPQEASEALLFLACGYELDVAIRESSRASLETSAPVNTNDFEAALSVPSSRREFRLIESELDLLNMLDESLEHWRVFLHPNQEAIVKANYRGPARVLGGAGTGKTVVAMHRARHLARRYPDAKILFTTFNRNLAANIAGLLDDLCGEERDRIEVTNLHAWAVGHCKARWGQPEIAGKPQRDACWDDVLAQASTSLGWEAPNYAEEWEGVIQFHGITTRDGYLRASRAGSPSRLTRAQRVEIWQVLSAYRAGLERRGLMDWDDVLRRVRESVEREGRHPYRAIVVDEAQDLSAEAWRLLRALAPNQDDSLFITGDAHQRIYGRPITLSHFGIPIRGRSRRLKINYRTTEQVLRWSTRLLDDLSFDDMDGGQDTTTGYRSLYRGPEPEVFAFASVDEQTCFLLQRVRRLLDSGAQPEEIAVVFRYSGPAKRLVSVFAEAEIPTSRLKKDGEPDPGVRVATMHRVKGLDFTHVVMVVPAQPDESVDVRDRSLLYVAATRCRKTLTVVHSG
ncbi:MAG: UvrD-helicase domain-containing protein [Myxococcota bacterium]